MIDMHSHILADIDDGSKSWEMSLEMLRMAVNSGTTDIIATPHVNRQGVIPSWPDITDKVNLLQQKAKAAAININIHSGAEVGFDYDALRFIKEGSRDYCLAGSRYILVEFTEQSQPDQAEKLLYELMLRGFVPVLAHPERYERIMAHPKRVLEWMNQGTLTQCNTGSFTGYFGKTVQKRAEGLRCNHMVTFLGSDAHCLESRNTDMREAGRAIHKLDNKKVDTLTACEHNAATVLQDKVLYPELPKQWKKPHSGFLSRFLHTFSLI